MQYVLLCRHMSSLMQARLVRKWAEMAVLRHQVYSAFLSMAQAGSCLPDTSLAISATVS